MSQAQQVASHHHKLTPFDQRESQDSEFILGRDSLKDIMGESGVNLNPGAVVIGHVIELRETTQDRSYEAIIALS